MENGSITLFAAVVLVSLTVGGLSGAVLSSAFIEGPKTIDIPEGTLIVPADGEPYYYFENGIVIANQVFEVLVDNLENFIITNYVPKSDNYVIIYQGSDICRPTIVIQLDNVVVG